MSANSLDAFSSAQHLPFLLIGRHRCWDQVRIAVMADLMSRFDYSSADILVGVDNDAWNKPGCRYLVFCKQSQDSRRADESELTARDWCWCRHAAGGPA